MASSLLHLKSKDDMCKLVTLLFLTLSYVASAHGQSRIEINAQSTRRSVCDVKFANIRGLAVIATRVPESHWHSRVSVERYAACPYDIRLKYRGRSMQIDFNAEVTLDMLESKEAGMAINTGLFNFNGETWVTNYELVEDSRNHIKVENFEHEILITGTVRQKVRFAYPPDFCFSVALLRKQGLVTGGICRPNFEDVQPFSDLFSTRVISTK
jgi:hypothetical protein